MRYSPAETGPLVPMRSFVQAKVLLTFPRRLDALAPVQVLHQINREGLLILRRFPWMELVWKA